MRIITFILILISTGLSAQVLQETNDNRASRRIVTKIALRLPHVCNPVTAPDIYNYSGDSARGALVYDTCNDNIKWWNGAAWDSISAGSGITQLTNDVTAGPGSGSQAATIAANAVTDAKFRQSAGLSVVGRSANSTGNVADITAATDHHVLRRSGTSIGFGTLNAAAMNPTYTNGYTLQTDGSGGLTWVAPSSGGTPGGGQYAIQYNRNGSFAGSQNFVFDSVNNRVGINYSVPLHPLEVSGSVAGQINVRNNATGNSGYSNLVFTANETDVYNFGIGEPSVGVSTLRSRFYLYNQSESQPILTVDSTSRVFFNIGTLSPLNVIVASGTGGTGTGLQSSTVANNGFAIVGMKGGAGTLWELAGHGSTASVLANGFSISGGGTGRLNINSTGGVAIGNGLTTAAASSILDITNTTRGLLIPRMTRAQKVAISSPAQGLQVIDTDNRAIWKNLNGSTTTWGAIYAAQDTVATNANFTLPVYSSFVNLPTITVDRTLTLPAAASYENKTITIKVSNSAAFAWLVTPAIKDNTDADITTLTNDTVYTIFSDGTNWNIIHIYP